MFGLDWFGVYFSGTISIFFVLAFVAYKGAVWGIHVDLNPAHSTVWDYSPGI